MVPFPASGSSSDRLLVSLGGICVSTGPPCCRQHVSTVVKPTWIQKVSTWVDVVPDLHLHLNPESEHKVTKLLLSGCNQTSPKT